jgi:hypothetical protein
VSRGGFGRSWFLSDVDLLCIDQANLAEKAVQIPLMKDIYSKAGHVIIWVGPPTQDSTLALPFLEQKLRPVYRAKDQKQDAELEWCLSQTSTTIESPEWQAVADLFCRPWFTRFWILQEAILAHKIVAWDGRRYCQWSGLVSGRKALSRGIYRHLRLRDKLKGPAAPEFVSLAELLNDYQFKRNNTFKSFTSGWWKSLSSQATNVKDYVYGVLGLIELEPDGSPAIVPDYRKSDVDVFVEAVSLCLQRDNSYNVLSLAGVGILDESRPLLPSWIPHFALEKIPRSLAMHVHPDSVPYCAGGPPEDVVLTRNFRFEDGNLIVKGAIVDTVCELTDTYTDRRCKSDTDKDIFAWTRRAIAFAHKSSIFDISVSESWEKWARTMSSNWLKVKAGSEDEYSPQAYVTKYELFLRLFVNNPKVKGLDYEEAYAGIFGDPEFSDNEKKDADYHVRAMDLTLLFKRIATTERGDLAVVQSLSKVGDRICVLPGGKTPYTIRKVSGDDEINARYEFVGESYVDSLMSGIGLSMAPLQDIMLV